MDAEYEMLLCFSWGAGSTGAKFFLQKQSLTKGTSLSNQGTPVHQSERNGDTGQADETKKRSTPGDTKGIVKGPCSEWKQCSGNAAHNHRSSHRTGRVDFVRISDICQKGSEYDLVPESEYET